MTRPRAEHCDRLAVGDLRPLVAPGAEAHQLADGTLLRLRWAELRGCFGGRGQALVIRCPGCDSHARVLWKPPGADWRCWRCQPISHRSHRRPGARRGRPKPVRWHLAQIGAEQQQIADLLGLQSWPPQRILWSWKTLGLEDRRPDAPRLSADREWALTLRLDALETLRIARLLPTIDANLRDWGHELPAWEGMPSQVASARRLITATEWAMRRGARDPRTLRGGRSGVQVESTAGEFVSGTVRKIPPTSDSGLAHLRTVGSVRTSHRDGHGLTSPRRDPEAQGQQCRAALVPRSRQASATDAERAGPPVHRD